MNQTGQFFHLYTVSVFINIAAKQSDFGQKQAKGQKLYFSTLICVYVNDFISFYLLLVCACTCTPQSVSRGRKTFCRVRFSPSTCSRVPNTRLGSPGSYRTHLQLSSHHLWRFPLRKMIKNNKRNIHWHLKNLEPPMAFHFCERDLAQKVLYHRENKWEDCA